MSKENFEYCNTCGAAEYPECSICGKQFWHRDPKARLNALKGKGLVQHWCPDCDKTQFTFQEMQKLKRKPKE